MGHRVRKLAGPQHEAGTRVLIGNSDKPVPGSNHVRVPSTPGVPLCFVSDLGGRALQDEGEELFKARLDVGQLYTYSYQSERSLNKRVKS